MNRNLWFLAAALFSWGLGEGMFFNFMPIYLDERFGLGKQEIGVALGAMGFFMLVTHIPSGHLADRIGRRPVLIAAWVMGLVTTFLMALAVNLPVYLIGMFGYGVTAFVSSPLSSYVTAERARWSLGTTLAVISAAFNSGMALGPLGGGWVGDHYGMDAVYWVATVIFVFSTALIFFIAPQPLERHDAEAPPVNVWQNRPFIVFLTLAGCAVFATYLAQPLTPNFLKDMRGLSLGDTGVIFSAGAFGNALLTVAVSRFKPRYGFAFAQGLVALFALLIWKGSTLPVFMLGYFLFGGFRAMRPMAQAQARDLAHPSQMGLMYGALETVNAIIFIVAPPLAGFIYERDPFVIYPLAIGLIGFSIAGSLFYARKVSHA